MNSSIVSRSLIAVVSIVVFGSAIYFGRNLIFQLFPGDGSNDLTSSNELGELIITDEGRQKRGVSDESTDANGAEPGEAAGTVEIAGVVESEGGIGSDPGEEFSSDADVEIRKKAFEGYFEPVGFDSPSKDVVISAESSMPVDGSREVASGSEVGSQSDSVNVGSPPKVDGPDEPESDSDISLPVVDELVDTSALIDSLESAEAQVDLSVGTGDGTSTGLAISAAGSEVAVEVAGEVTESLPLIPVASTADLNAASVTDLPTAVVGELVNVPVPAEAPQATRERAPRAPRAGMIYSNALGGSVSGLIGGMDRPSSPTSRVRVRNEVVSGGYGAQGGGAPSGVDLNQAGANVGVAAGIPSTASSLPVSQLPSIISPAAGSVTGSTGAIVPAVPAATTSGAEALNSVVPSVSVGLPGLGINTGGAGVGINVNLNLP
ncbi:hypothetical protein VSU19_02715 [Verrucomicrobiales bacterium BCK34]|nr:hypothetical protein [Verrucomicrobiales bacterium BCK34]